MKDISVIPIIWEGLATAHKHYESQENQSVHSTMIKWLKLERNSYVESFASRADTPTWPRSHRKGIEGHMFDEDMNISPKTQIWTVYGS